MIAMDERLLPRTAAMNRGPTRQAGLLGQGQMTFPSERPAPRTSALMTFGGYYAIDDFSAAMILISELKDPESGLNETELKSSVLFLNDLIANMKNASEVSAEALANLQKEAISIPVVGPLLFSTSNLPGTVAGVGGVISAALKTKKVSDLVDLPPGLQKTLNKWAKTKGSENFSTVNKKFKGRLKIIRINGKLHLEVPLTAEAIKYRIFGANAGRAVHIPTTGTAKALNSSARLHSKGARGVPKLIGGNIIGLALAVGPQAYMDAKSSNSMGEFLDKSADTQPTNLAAFGAGFIATVVIGTSAPLVIIIAAGITAGMAAQYFMGESGWDKSIAERLKRWRASW
ncbi:hypothetical protein ALQ48_04452 [Pseudomonas coronafaciens pv. zizaniae]|nr:hypothetical protein ALQ61_01883 [Pseudomonas coronafaciens pv. zizaniae]RMO10821.1 hypothetical protein ALQ48_04452 [Pseudomonas coronafaciens pv. zizaniae]RMS92966.1 hypothetical protein ALP56_03805 [Pseudomonas coronafaciens pv. oryzae]RMS93434.1 hypothetical protein ALP57_00362 [Pseudomonas coronafaciens pv. oryzae]RMV87732.1 hypothetical protein ALP02_00562 [Pseudomonas coronafaciens pv. garcae]